MDARHFDRLTRILTEAGSRRGLLGLLTALPVLGGIFALLDPDELDAKGRRKRRKKRHKHGKGRRRKHHKKCQAESKAKTCSGTCGSVTNNCKKTVDCGSCNCESACEECFICQSGPNTPGTCVVDPEQVGEPCGSDGQVCQADGACACQAGSCPDEAPICDDGACVACSAAKPCSVSQCCNAATGQCVASCPSCQICDGGICVATPDGAACGTQSGGGTLRCCAGTCPNPTCRPAGTECPGENPATCRLSCCSDSAGICNPDCECLGRLPTISSQCGSDADCRQDAGEAQCRCGRCCLLAGQAALDGNCGTCCGATCQPATQICA